MAKSPKIKLATGPFDFTRCMNELCEDITNRHEAFMHIDMSRIAVTFAQTRSSVLHGMQAKLTPMRFENGSLTERRQNRTWGVQRLYLGKREMLYILTFYLPRFLEQSFQEKFVTILHELYHISAKFDGDIRRFAGRCHVHTHSQDEYDGQMEVYAREYLSMRPPEHLYEFLRSDFSELKKRHGGVVGLQVPIPKLIPIQDTKSA
ncbi:putative metallopeptidase [Planctomicrobium sp.]|jgi:predicted metallopeptidase|nr:putative metallopeptidase [Planctomicrobium sp.]MDB4439595.1 putative metallopeptidase [Planctomicrobium sp.]MDB4732862.1 putative metallopeptidase [Planctomicrobium sp.]